MRIWIQTSDPDPQPDPVRIWIFTLIGTYRYLFSDVRQTLLSSFEENRRRRFTLKRSWLEELDELGKGTSLVYHRERILETSTLSCNEEEEEITKPPTR